MRQITLAVVAILALLTTSGAFAQGLLTNADFSADLSGWAIAPETQALYRFTDEDGHPAPGALRYSAEDETPAGPVTQRFACEPGADLVLTAAAKSDGTIRAEVQVVEPATGRVISGLQWRRETAWTAQTAQFNTLAATELEVRICGSSEIPITGVAQVGTSAFDSVQVYPLADVPDEARTQALFTPPGPNIALGQPYTYKPRARYGLCSDASDATQLTDGAHTVGYFWTQKSTVGWMRSQHADITIDLGEDRPIAGVSVNSAAGVAGVDWPTALFALVSEDGEAWYLVGDLKELSDAEQGPPPAGYSIHRYATSALQTHGRYVRLIAVYFPFFFSDEIEVYEGDEALLAADPPGELMADVGAFVDEATIVAARRQRLMADLGAVRTAIASAEMPDAERAGLLARADELEAEIDALPPTVPEDFDTILPLNDLHARIYALNAPLLRAAGHEGLVSWKQNRWDPLKPMQGPAETGRTMDPDPLRVDMMLNEWRGEVVNLTNATDEAMTAVVSLHDLPGGDNPAWVSVREVLHTDTRDMRSIAAALPEAEAVEGGFAVTIPAGTTRQVWLSFHPEAGDVEPGAYGGRVNVIAEGAIDIGIALDVRIFPFTFPEQPTLSLGGWDYCDAGGYGLTANNRDALIEKMVEHYVDTPWATRGVLPSGAEFDAEGNLTNELNFTRWDRWVGWWPTARYYNVFQHAQGEFAGEPMGTARFDRMVASWITAWVEHMREQGIEPGQLQLLIYDEPNEPHEAEIIAAWAKALKAAQPEVRVWSDPRFPEPWNIGEAEQQVLELSDALCPNTYVFLRGDQRERDAYMAATGEGAAELWFYDCSGPGKALDPYAYHRGQMWAALKYGALGCGYWCFTCSGGGSGSTSWNAYAQKSIEYSPLFIGETTATDGKHMEAIREGIQDYEYAVMLRARVEELKARGVQNAAIAASEALLAEAPDRVVGPIAEKGVGWLDERDRTVMDTVRVEMLEALAALQGL